MKIIILKYEDVNWYWVSSHWDYHLNGLCKHKGEIWEFKHVTSYKDIFDTHRYNLVLLFKLNIFKKLLWIYRKKMFEWCVGYHWTYPQRKNGETFYKKDLIWLHNLILRIYYKTWKV